MSFQATRRLARRSAPWLPWIGLTLTLGSRPAAAQETVRDAAVARRLFQEGVACGDAEDWTCAAARFEQAYASRPSPVIASNWAEALAHVGRLVEAHELFGRVERDAAAPRALVERARAQREALAPRLGGLRVRLESDHAVVVEVDGRPLAPALLDTDLPTDPGEHHVVVRDGTAVVTEATVTLGEGAHELALLTVPSAESAATVELPAPFVQEPTPSAIVTAPNDDHTERDWFAALGIGGAAVVAIGAVVGVVVATSAGADPFVGTLGFVEVRP